MGGKRLYREYDENGTLIRLECSYCQEIKSVDNFYKNKCKKDGYQNFCKECESEYKKECYIKNHKIKRLYREYDENGTLIKLECRDCHEIKTVDNFHKGKKYKDGVVTLCKNCKKKYDEVNSKQYYINNKEKVSERLHQYRINNKEKEKERHTQYYQKNKEKISEYKKQYNLKNKEKLIEYRQQYYLINQNKLKEYWNKNRDKRINYHKEYHKNKADEEIKRIYENVTKNLYPNNGIQYGVIYGVHCIFSDRWYIGQTRKSFNLRYDNNFFNRKTIELSNDSIKGKLLQDDIEKYGKENFEIFEVIDVAFSEKELDEKEAYYIDYHKAYDEGYNSNRGNIFKHEKSKRKDVI